MATNPNDTRARKAVGKFARALLATTCLTVASGAAVASTMITYTEGISPAPSDFSNTFSGAASSSLLAATDPGITIINGQVTGGNSLDYIELTGLGTGNFDVDVVDTAGIHADATIYDTTQANLGGPTFFSNVTHADFGLQSIPLNGDLVIEIQTLNEGTNSYTVTVQTTAPEPGTLATAGLGLAGAVALARKRRKKS